MWLESRERQPAIDAIDRPLVVAQGTTVLELVVDLERLESTTAPEQA
jgi:hypothetical protein